MEFNNVGPNCKHLWLLCFPQLCHLRTQHILNKKVHGMEKKKNHELIHTKPKSGQAKPVKFKEQFQDVEENIA